MYYNNIGFLCIGIGAVCIYPLLLAKIYGCYMLGTEVDNTSIESAIENVKNNNLENLIRGIPLIILSIVCKNIYIKKISLLI